MSLRCSNLLTDWEGSPPLFQQPRQLLKSPRIYLLNPGGEAQPGQYTPELVGRLTTEGDSLNSLQHSLTHGSAKTMQRPPWTPSLDHQLSLVLLPLILHLCSITIFVTVQNLGEKVLGNQTFIRQLNKPLYNVTKLTVYLN